MIRFRKASLVLPLAWGCAILLSLADASLGQPSSRSTSYEGDMEAFDGMWDDPYQQDSGEANNVLGIGPGYSRCDSRWWVDADFLLWWIEGNQVPALLTTSPQQTPREEAGVLGQPGTSILFGDAGIDEDYRQGFRLTLGTWLDECREWGVEGHYFFVGGAGGGYATESVGDPILARPFFNAAIDAQDSQLVAFPGFVEGQFRIDTSSDVNSAGVLLRRTVLRGCEGQVALLGGYRYFRFRERLRIDESLTIVDETGLIDFGTTLDVRDDFSVQNDFHGGEIGLAAELRRGRWSLDLLTKLGLGAVRRQLNISGMTVVTVPDAPSFSQNTGMLTRASNIGPYSDTGFAFLPELGVNVGYCLTPSLTVRGGYSLLWFSDALRTGSQVDLAVGDSGVPGAVLHPQASMATTSAWMQGVHLGIEWRR
jgi:hypothetical protein